MHDSTETMKKNVMLSLMIYEAIKL